MIAFARRFEGFAFGRLGLSISLLVVLASAAVAQARFAPDTPALSAPVLLYLLSAFVLILCLRRVERAESAPALPNHRSSWSALLSVPRLLLIALALGAALLAADDLLRTSHPDSYAFDVALWLFSVAAFGVAFVPWPDRASLNRRTLKERIAILLSEAWPELLAVLAIGLFALVLRGWQLTQIPANFSGDEGEMGMQARLFIDGRLTNPFATGWMDHQTMWFALQSLSLRLFGNDEFGLRMLSVLAGTLSVLTCYLLVRELFGRELALLAALLLAGYSFHIHFSRVAISSISDPFWEALVLFLLARAVKSGRLWLFVAAGLALGCSQYFYHGIRLLVVIIGVLGLYWLVSQPRVVLTQWRSFALMGGAALVAAVPLILYYAGQPDLLTSHYQAMGIFPSGWVAHTAEATGQSVPAILLGRTWRSLMFFNAFPDTTSFYGPGTPLLEPVSAAFFVLGLGYSLYRIKDWRYFLMVEWFVLAIILGAVMVNDENGSERLVTASIPVVFFVAVGLYKLGVLAARAFNSARVRPAALIAPVAILVLLSNLHAYFLVYTPQRTYARDGAARLTMMADVFRAQTEPYKVYFFGPPYDYLTNGVIRFLTPGLNGMDVKDKITRAPSFVDRSRAALFVFRPERQSELAIVQQAFPNGERRDYSLPDGRKLFILYEVSP